MSALQIGSYVQYNSLAYLVTYLKGSICSLVNETSGIRKILLADVSLINHLPAVSVKHKGRDYLATSKGMIVSLGTNKVMKWDARNGNRTNILALAKYPKPTKPPCDRCGGSGYIAMFSHWDAGVCYKCR